MKRTGKMLAGLLSAALLLTGCTDVTTENGLRANIYTYDEAEKELDVLTNTIQTSTVEAPVLDI